MDAFVKPLGFKHYLTLTKPGIIMGNLITMTAGFGLASSFAPLLFAQTAVGLSFIVASACVWNNIIDRHHDAKMERTKNRPLVTKALSVPQAALFGAILLALGVALFATINTLTTLVALGGLLIYVFPYSFLKYHTAHATLIGSIAGAAPPLVGSCAATGELTRAGLILFALIVVWQMPHFFAIALYRLDDYRSAQVPILPLKRGILATKWQILLYVILFGCLACFLPKGAVYLVVAATTGLIWLILALLGFKAQDVRLWARKMFFFSLIAVMVISAAIFFLSCPS